MSFDNYEAIAITVGLPEPGTGKVTSFDTYFEAKRILNWLQYNYKGLSLEDYAKEAVLGDNLSKQDFHDPDSRLVQIQPTMQKIDMERGEIYLSFERQWSEPIGKSMLWILWEQYDDREETCWPTDYCLNAARIEG